MARLKVVGSGSAGNCYIIECERETLVLDLGSPWKDILAGLNFDIKPVVGCIVSHEHTDHSQSIKNALMYDIPVYTNEATELKVGGIALQHKKAYLVGENFTVLPLRVPHGDVECYSYIVRHPEIGSLLFCTDLTSFPYTVPNLNHILIEANYSKDTLVEQICENAPWRSHPENHLSIDTCCEILSRHKSSALNNVMLVHLSRTNSDEKAFRARVRDVIGMEPFVAHPGVSFDINKDEF